jgi:DNA invertase Pin-like site-specific DNA recombinase
MRPRKRDANDGDGEEKCGDDMGEREPPTGEDQPFTRQQFDTVRDMLGQHAAGIAQIAKATGLSRQTVYRIKDDPAGSEAALAAWGL